MEHIITVNILNSPKLPRPQSMGEFEEKGEVWKFRFNYSSAFFMRNSVVHQFEFLNIKLLNN
jgi:hypothetical protein